MKMKIARSIAVLALGLLALPGTALAQQKLGYIDSEYILSKTPDYATVQQQIDRMAQEWQSKVESRKKEVDEKFREYQARELLYTNEERKTKQEEIMQAEAEVERLRMEYFGPEGQLFTQQEQLMRPLQERVLAAVETVAREGGYDYVFDKSGDFLFMYTREQYDLSDDVLQELGIDVETAAGN